MNGEFTMFANLTQRLGDAVKNLVGKGVLTEENIQDVVKEVKNALLEADVALPVVNNFIETVKQNAIGKSVHKSMSPDKVFIKVVYDAMVELMGPQQSDLDLAVQPPAVLLMAGLQGAGKTTTSAKLAHWIRTKKKKRSIMLVSLDVYRPAARQQLQTLAKQVKADFFSIDDCNDPCEIAKAALEQAKKKFIEVVIFDTAGRLHVDEEMMQEIKSIHALVNPVETLFVVDAMTGQDAVNTAKAFDEAIPLTGVVLSKTDGDARGGAALSVKAVTGKPIKFMGVAEKVDGLEIFYPDRVASRILDMGDVLSLVEDLQENIDVKKAKRMEKKFRSGQGFNFNDMLDQFEQMAKLGGMTKLLGRLPGMSQIAQLAESDEAQKRLNKTKAMIFSMTKAEREDPELISPSRKARIAKGSGSDLNEVNQLLKQFKQMQKTMKKMGKKDNMQSMMRQMQGMMNKGGFPRM
tara:strand:+ start:1029 stop:2417 length:1389 start_codon:yes stop_codon:yes gene_type:complete